MLTTARVPSIRLRCHLFCWLKRSTSTPPHSACVGSIQRGKVKEWLASLPCEMMNKQLIILQ